MTDDPVMNTETTSSESAETRTSPSRPPLVRPTAGRSIAGVAAGLAAYLGLSVGLVRFLFLVTVLFGGAGLVLYVAGWLLIRDEAEPESIAQRLFDSIGSGPSWIGVVLVVVAALIVLDNLTILSGSLLWAAVLVVAGLLLYRGDVGGARRPRERPASAAADVSVTDNNTVGDDNRGDDVGGTPPPPVPSRPTPPPAPAAPPQPPSILGRLTIGVALLALGVLAVVDNLTPLVEPRPRHYLALATVVIGVGLLVGSVAGRARWMILLGVFLLPPLLASPVAEVDWQGFERTIAPADPSLLDPRYELATGQFVFDLTNADWNGQSESLVVDMGAGEIIVMVPSEVGITGQAQVGMGQIDSPTGGQGGLGDISRDFDIPGTAGTLDLDLELGVGSIRILHRGGLELSPGRIQPIDNTDLVDVELGSGDVELDLRRLDLTSDDDLQVQVGTGNVTVLTPGDLNLVVVATVGSGTVALFDAVTTADDGGSTFTHDRISDAGSPTLHLYIEVSTGNIDVTERNR